MYTIRTVTDKKKDPSQTQYHKMRQYDPIHRSSILAVLPVGGFLFSKVPCIQGHLTGDVTYR